MRNFKKIIAVLVTITMLLGTVALSASAGAAPKVVLEGRTQIEVEDTYEAKLKVTNAETGGVQGTITYNPSYLDFEEVVFTDAFATANKSTTDAVKVDEENGTIAFIGINPGNDVVWFTLKFKALATVDATKFDLDDTDSAPLKLVSSKIDGKDVWTKTLFAAPSVEIVKAGQVKMLGGTIKATAEAGKQDIKFIAGVDYTDGLDIVEYGVIFLPSQLLNGQELLADPNTVYGTNSNGKPIKAAIAKTDEDFGEKAKFYGTLTGSSSYQEGTLRQIDMSSRAYIKLSDGTVEYLDVLYSNNDDEEDDNIVDGHARKSIIGIAKKMAGRIIVDTDVVFTDGVDSVDTFNKLDAKTVLETDEEFALLDFIVTNKALVEKYAIK